MKLTQEQVGAALGVVLIIAAIFGIPYLSVAFVQWKFNPALWDLGGRFFCVLLALVLAFAYAVNLLPETEDDGPRPLYDSMTGARILYPSED